MLCRLARNRRLFNDGLRVFASRRASIDGGRVGFGRLTPMVGLHSTTYGGRYSAPFDGGRRIIPPAMHTRFQEYSIRPNGPNGSEGEGPNGKFKKFVIEFLRKLLEAFQKFVEAFKNFLEAFQNFLIHSRVRAFQLHEMYYPSVVVGIISSAIWTAIQAFVVVFVLGQGNEASQIRAEVASVATFLDNDKKEKLRRRAEKMKAKEIKEEMKRLESEKKEDERLAKERERKWFKW